MAVVLFSALSILILNPLTSWSTTESFVSTTLVSYIDPSNSRTIVVEHRGGDMLPHYKVTFTISTLSPPTQVNITKTQDDSGIQEWSVGERCNYTAAGSLTNTKVEVLVVDLDKNSILLDKVLQDYNDFATPYVQVYNPNDDPKGVTENSAVLRLYYNFVKYKYYFCPNAGTVNFVYQKLDNGGTPITNVSSALFTPLPLEGLYSITLTGLAPDSHYQVRGVIRWGLQKVETPFVQFWTYSTARGLWHLDEAFTHGGGDVAYDASRPPTDGAVSGATFKWDAAHNNGFLNFSAPHQKVEVSNNHKFDLDTQMTVRAWINSRPGGALFYGQMSQIDNASLDSLPGVWLEPVVTHISGDVYAAVYHTLVDPGATITTFRMPSDYVIPTPLTVIDSQIFADVSNYQNNPDILSLGNGLYAVSFGSRHYDTTPAGYIMTVSITDEGVISDSMIGQMMTNFYGKMSRLFQVNGSLYGVAFGGDYSKTYLHKTGGVVTFSIDESGYFSMPLCQLKLDEDYCSKIDVVQVGADVFALAYNSDSNGSSCIRTIQISNGGNVTYLRRSFFSLADHMEPSIVAGSLPNQYIVAFGGDSTKPVQGVLRMVSIASDGTILSISGSQLLPSNTSVSPKIMALKGDLYLVAYSEGSPLPRCHTATFKVTDHIELRDKMVFLYDDAHHQLQGLGATIVALNDDHMLAVYGSSSIYHGVIASISINFVSVPQFIVSKGAMFQIELVDTTITATVRTADGSHSVSGTLIQGGWNHMVLVYSSSTLSLYINKVLSGPIPCLGILEVNADPLIIGSDFIGYLDEVGIYAQGFDAAGVANDYVSTNHYA